MSVNGETECGVSKQWPIIQPYKGRESWIKFKDIMLSEVSESQTKTAQFHRHEVPRGVKSTD